jgi:hypothetical protein
MPFSRQVLRAALASTLPLLSLAFTALHVGSFPCRGGLTAGPGFLAVDGDALLVSRFTGDPLEQDDVAAVRGFAALLAAGNVSAAECTRVAAVTWPNDAEPARIALGARGAASVVLAPGGFLVPPKTIGAVTLLNSSAGAPAAGAFILTTPKVLPGDGWFYHRAVPFDVDGDGRVDVLAARATKPLVEAPAGELVWLQQPAVADPLAPAALPWAEHTLAGGAWAPDVLFAAPVSLRADADEQLLFASFFTGGGLGMLQCSGCAGGGAAATWATANLTRVVLDASIGPAFDVAAVDVNGDGRLDALVTNHADNATAVGGVVYQSQVLVYEAPLAPAPLANASAWTRHVLLDGLVVREPGPNQAAPGAARAFAPPAGAGARAWVSVAGDGDQRAYVLTPDAADPSSWAYSVQLVHDCKGTVGRQVSLVVDARSFLVIPCYDSGLVEVYELRA